jgi:arylsulfatase A-like enzyme
MEGHGWTLYDEVTHVPLILRFPKHEHAATRVPALVRSIDIAPTILDAAGLESPGRFRGRSLMPLVRGEPDPEPPAVFSETRRFNQKWAVRTEQHKLVYTASARYPRLPSVPAFELYDLGADPGEQSSVFSADSEVAQTLVPVLRAFAQSKGTQEREAPVLTEEERRRLRALGYIE